MGKYWRPPVLGLAAVVLFAAPLLTSPLSAQPMPLSERIQMCGTCHGEDGNSKMENIPSIAGQPAFFILNQLVLMRENVRQVEAMAPIVKDSEATTTSPRWRSILRSLRPSRAASRSIRLWSSAARRSPRRSDAISCHLQGLTGQQQVPRLAKQRVDYLAKSLKEFRDSTRHGADTIMSGPVSGLSDAELMALAHYAASR